MKNFKSPVLQDEHTTKRQIAVAQLDIRAGEIDANLDKIKRTIREHRSADMIVFPELILHGHLYSTATREEVFRVIRRTKRDVSKEMYAYARRFTCQIIYGELFTENGKLYNTAVYLDGGHIQHYHKTHVHWTEIFDPGDTLPVFGTGLHTTGILICYDMAFPEAARTLALSGARVIVVIAAIPRTFDKRYILRRLTSIALDNQVFVVFANRAGRDYYGGSMVLDPRGDVIALAGEKEEVLRTEIDFASLERWRKEEAIFSQRRPELYRLISDS